MSWTQPTTATALYPDRFKSHFDAPCDYTPIINDLGTVLVRHDDDDYQGDTRLALKLGPKLYGFVVIGWGSCSGCDALQASDTPAAVDELIADIRRDVKTFPTLKALKRYVADDGGRKGAHSWHVEGWRAFADKVAAL